MPTVQAPRVRRAPPEPAADHFRWRRWDLTAHVVRLSLSGEIDDAAAGELDEVLHAAASNARIIVLDLEGLTSVDRPGARVLRAAAARARKSGHRLVAVDAPDHVESALVSMGIDRCLKLVVAPAS